MQIVSQTSTYDLTASKVCCMCSVWYVHLCVFIHGSSGAIHIGWSSGCFFRTYIIYFFTAFYVYRTSTLYAVYITWYHFIGQPIMYIRGVIPTASSLFKTAFPGHSPVKNCFPVHKSVQIVAPGSSPCKNYYPVLAGLLSLLILAIMAL